MIQIIYHLCLNNLNTFDPLFVIERLFYKHDSQGSTVVERGTVVVFGVVEVVETVVGTVPVEWGAVVVESSIVDGMNVVVVGR